MKGHVPTPDVIVDLMVAKLFEGRPPKATDVVLDPGCGDGPFINGVLRYCERNGLPVPRIHGVELNPALVEKAEARFRGHPKVRVTHVDYLLDAPQPASFIIGNPPYVSITGLDEAEKAKYRARFATAKGRFDLYLLFFERSLQNLRSGGRLCFITPEKFEYVQTAEPLRKQLAKHTLEELYHVDEATFPGLTTYPVITTLTKAPAPPGHAARIRFRDGREADVALPADGRSWSGLLNGLEEGPSGPTLADVCLRISCGIATGADEVFVVPRRDVPASLRSFAYPTLSGRQLGTERKAVAPEATDVMLVPYSMTGELLPERTLGGLKDYLLAGERGDRLRQRTCVARPGRAWYRFHDSVPLTDILKPKLLCKDITATPHFWADRKGEVVPRHSVYYLVPRAGVDLAALQRYLNGEEAAAWLRAHCQRAANDFMRLQSSVLKRLPVPEELMGQVRDAKAVEKGPVQVRLGETARA